MLRHRNGRSRLANELLPLLAADKPWRREHDCPARVCDAHVCFPWRDAKGLSCQACGGLIAMSTNYYLQNKPCSHCGIVDSKSILHIGKSSRGWCFGLHVMPECGICSLDDWRLLFQEPSREIVDEYGRRIGVDQMLSIVTERSWRRPPEFQWDCGAYAEPGPNGLYRHKIIPDWCIGHGEGTWDCIVGEFR